MTPLSAQALQSGHQSDSDVLVVGSGAGGAVVAYELSRAGYAVTVLEAGPHQPSSSFAEHMPSALEQLYVDQGAQTNSDGDITILQGRCLGGSTVVNATVAFRIPEPVLKHWRHSYGLHDYSVESLEPLYQQIELDLAIHRNAPHEINRNSQLMQIGAQRLGWRAEPLPRNVKDCVLSGYCIAGCRYDRKQSMLVTYLPWAQRHGAQIYCDAPVKRVLHEAGQAKGVIVETPAGDAVFKARLVVIAAGSVHTPLLLQDSGLGSAQVGSHFACHPALSVLARFDSAVQQWQGAQMGVYVDQFSDDPQGGFLLEGGGSEPASFAQFVPGASTQAAQNMARADQMAALVALIHDEGSGRIYRKQGRKTIDYRLSARDQARARAALKASARLWFAAGAQEVYLPTALPQAVHADNAEQIINALDMGPGSLMYSAFHPQSSCRMGADPASSALNPHAQLHGMDNLVVADASSFPSSVRVNTQLPVYVVAAKIAQTIRQRPERYGLS